MVFIQVSFSSFNIILEGVIVVKKDVRAPKHTEIAVPNLQVMKALQSLKSRGYVTEQFSWQYYYFFLTDEGILFLRQYLHLPESVVPITIAKAQRSGAPRRAGIYLKAIDSIFYYFR